MAGPFHLSNSYAGPRYQLQVDPSSGGRLELYMTVSSGLLWTLNSTDDANKVNICTSYGDSHSQYCLDIWGDNKTLPHLADPDTVYGQQWTRSTGSGNYVKLSNDYSGSNWYLDTTPDTLRAFMSQGDTTGQEWRIDPVSSAISSSPLMSSSATSATQVASTASSPTSGVLGTSSASSQPTTPASTGLDTSAKIGIGVGVGLGVPLLALVALVLVFRSRIFGTRHEHTTGPSGKPTDDNGAELYGYGGNHHEKSTFVQASTSGPAEMFAPAQRHELGVARSPGVTTELP